MSAEPEVKPADTFSCNSGTENIINPPRPSLQKSRAEAASALSSTSASTVPRANPFIEHASRASINQPRPHEIIATTEDTTIELQNVDFQRSPSDTLSSVISSPHLEKNLDNLGGDTARVSLTKPRIQIHGRFSIEERIFARKLVEQPVRIVMTPQYLRLIRKTLLSKFSCLFS